MNEKTIEEYTKALKRRPKYADGYESRADTYYALDKYKSKKRL